MGEYEHDPVVLRQVERLEVRAVARAELGPGRKERRDVGAERRGERAQRLQRKRSYEGLVRESKRGRGVRAAAAEARGDGDALLDPRVPARLDAGRPRQLF